MHGPRDAARVLDEHRPSALVGDPQSYMFNFRTPSTRPSTWTWPSRRTPRTRARCSIPAAPAARLAPRQQTAVPLAFDPRVIAEHHAVVRVETDYRGERLTWRSPCGAW